MRKRILSIMLSLIMVVSFMPAMAWAENAGLTDDSPEGSITANYTDLDAYNNDAEQLVVEGNEDVEDNWVAQIGNDMYLFLQEAVNAVKDDTPTTIVLTKTTTGGGVVIPSGRNITIDLGGLTYTIGNPTVGSTGTETNGFQFLKDSDVTIQNGTIALQDDLKCAHLFQNYANLTLNNLDVNINNNNACETVLHSMHGVVHVKGNTNLTADGEYFWNESSNGNKKPIFVGDWSRNNAYTEGTQVYVDITGTIKGEVYTSAYVGNGSPSSTMKSKLVIQGGNIIGDIVESQYVEEYGVKTYIEGGSHTGDIITKNKNDGGVINSQITITGGDFSTDPAAYIPAEGDTYAKFVRSDKRFGVGTKANYTSVAHSPGRNTWTWNAEKGYYEESYVAPYIPSAPTDNVTNSGTTGTSSATTTADINTTTSGGMTSAVVDKTTADKIVDKAVSNQSTEVVVDVTTNAGTAGNTTVTLPTDTVQKIADKTNAEVTVKTDAAEVTLDQKAVEAVASKAAGSTVEIVVEKTKDETKAMEFELKVVSNGVVIGEFDGGNVKVTVKLNSALKALADDALTCVYIDDNGRYSKVGGMKNNDGTYTFVTNHISSYAIMAEEEADAVIGAQNEELLKGLDDIDLVARSVRTSKGNVKVTLKVDKAGKAIIDELKEAGYTVKYNFYRSTKKGSGYVSKMLKGTKTYTNTQGKKGTLYYYKARVQVYDAGGKLVARTALKDCRYASRLWKK